LIRADDAALMRAIRERDAHAFPPMDAASSLVTLVTPARNAAWCAQDTVSGVLSQDYAGPLEWIIFDDGSTDGTAAAFESHRAALQARGCTLKLVGAADVPPRGAGYARNRAIESASPDSALYVFLDADDVCLPRRVSALVQASKLHSTHTLLGSLYERPGLPHRPRETAWHASLSQQQLVLQRLREVTMPLPTWAVTPTGFAATGSFHEAGGAYNAEDLRWFYAHLRRGGTVHRLDFPLLVYRHSPNGAVAARRVPASLIWTLRVEELEATVLCNPPWCNGFTIWGAGKEGRRLYSALCPQSKAALRAFCDVDAAKLERGRVDFHDAVRRRVTASVPVVHFRRAVPPVLLCVKAMGLAGDPEQDGSFEANLASHSEWTEGADFLHFS